MAYEAGPTGFGLARALNTAGVRCVVAAPSMLQRPAGDRIKTDNRDVLHLARLLRMDEIVEVRVPGVAEEAARDLDRHPLDMGYAASSSPTAASNAFDAGLEAMLLTLDRRNRLDKAIGEMAADCEYTALVHRLGCLRGVSTLTAFGLPGGGLTLNTV